MTGTQILELAETHVDDDIDETDGLRWLNECVGMDLGGDAHFIKSGSVAATDSDTWYDLPTDFLRFTMENGIEDSDGDVWYGTVNLRKFVTVAAVTLAQTWAYKARFSKEDTFAIYYHANPTDLTELSQTPQTDPAFHKAIALYVASRYKSQDDDENKDAARLMGEYMKSKSDILSELAAGEVQAREVW